MAEPAPIKRAFITLFSIVLFAAIGFVLALGLGAHGLWPDERPIVDALPLMAVCGIAGGALAYRYPKVFDVFLWFMP